MSLPKICSIFTAEAFAIKTALNLCIQVAVNGKLNNKHVLNFSDSLSVIQAINNNFLNVHQNKYILDIRKVYLKLRYELKITSYIIWIPAHRGITGNAR